MKSYKYTIVSIDGVVMTATTPVKIADINFDVHTLKINKQEGRVFINLEHILYITEEEVEI